jgi:hypothetical protein
MNILRKLAVVIVALASVSVAQADLKTFNESISTTDLLATDSLGDYFYYDVYEIVVLNDNAEIAVNIFSTDFVIYFGVWDVVDLLPSSDWGPFGAYSNGYYDFALYQSGGGPNLCDWPYGGCDFTISGHEAGSVLQLAVATQFYNPTPLGAYALTFSSDSQFSVSKVSSTKPVTIDIKPGSCPNSLNCKSKGVLPLAILGTVDFDVTEIDPATVRLAGVAPLQWDFEDVATPYEPLTGKQDCTVDCTEMGPDGYMDATLKFDTQEVIAALGEAVQDGVCIVAQLTGNLRESVGGTEIVGEDLIRINCKGN